MNKNILIVDDSKFIRALVNDEISQVLDASIFLASSYKEAADLLKTHSFALSILDVHLPDANNGEVIDMVLDHGIPVIVLSSGMSSLTKSIVLKKDIIEYVAKSDPLSIKYIATAVKRIFNNSDKYILVVDDLERERATIKSYLTKLNINVLEAGSANMALDMMHDRTHHISLVLIDYRLPDMDGMDLTVKLRHTYSKDRLAIIAIGEERSKYIASQFLRYGANDFMGKPFTYEEFTARINTNLELIDLFKEAKTRTKELKSAYELFNSGNIIVFKWDNSANWPVKYASASLGPILGYTQEVFLSSEMTYAEIVHEDDIDRVTEEVQYYSQKKADTFQHQHYRIRRQDGSYAWVSDTTNIIYDDQGEITQYIGYIADITDQHEKEEKLHEYIERFNLAIESSRDGLWDWDLRCDQVFYSPTLLKMLGHTVESLPATSEAFFAIIHEDDRTKADESLQAHMDGLSSYYEREYRIRTASGERKWVLNRAKVRYDKKGDATRIIGFYTDIDKRKELELKLERSSVTDNLTGLLNRNGFVKHFDSFQKSAQRHGRKMGLLYIDLDGFKAVNDEYGHLAGDEVLVIISERLTTMSRANELVVRLGGDEFVIFVPEFGDEKELIGLARRLVDSCQEPLKLAAAEVDIGMSIGISTADKETTLDDLLAKADKAMYHVKDSGKDGYFLSES